MIHSNVKYHLVYVSQSLGDSPYLISVLKSMDSVGVPYDDFPFLDEDARNSIDHYIHIPITSDLDSILIKLSSTFPDVFFTNIGKLMGSEILKFVDKCEADLDLSIEVGKFYKVVEGEFRNLVLRCVSVDDMFMVGSYWMLKKEYTMRVNKAHVVKDCDHFSPVQSLRIRNLVGGRKRKVILFDGTQMIIRGIFRYPTLYSLSNGLYIGGIWGFYFSLLRIKEIYADYEVHVLFDGGSLAKYLLDNKLKVRDFSVFESAYRVSLNWCKSLVKNLSYYVYSNPKFSKIDIGCSLVNLMSLDLQCDKVIVYSSDPVFSYLASEKVSILSPKLYASGCTQLKDEDYFKREYRVNAAYKLNWVKALFGEGVDDPKSIFSFLRHGGYPFRVKRYEVEELVNRSKTEGELVGAMMASTKIKPFVEGFKANLRGIESCVGVFRDGVVLDSFRIQYNELKILKLFQYGELYRELDMADRVIRILRGHWIY